SRHLSGERSEEERLNPQPGPKRFRPASASRSSAPHGLGQRLNSLDIELGAGLEQYLPTPLFRLRVMKKRLSDEIAELRGTLNKYARLPEHSPDLKRRIQSLQEHLFTLEIHQAQVDAELELYLSDSSVLYGFIKQFQAWKEIASRAASWLRQKLI